MKRTACRIQPLRIFNRLVADPLHSTLKELVCSQVHFLHDLHLDSVCKLPHFPTHSAHRRPAPTKDTTIDHSHSNPPGRVRPCPDRVGHASQGRAATSARAKALT